MSKLTVGRGQEIVQKNINTIYKLPEKYRYLTHYLSGDLRTTLLNTLNFLKDKKIILDRHKYMFFLSDSLLTVRVRKKKSQTGTSNRHINLLCALGLFRKEFQSIYHDALIDVNRNFLEDNFSKRPINVFSFRLLTEKELQRCEDRAKKLYTAGVTTGRMSFAYLMINGLGDLAKEVYPKNNRLSPELKKKEFKELLEVLEKCIDTYGYCTVQMLKDNLPYPDQEIDQLRRIFKQRLEEKYNYKRPTTEQIERWNLPDQKFVYTKKEKV